MHEKQRNQGLDVVRSVAIISVLLCHFHWVIQSNERLLEASRHVWWLFPMLGYYGVDLFFVLSGFLIGRILIRTFAGDTNGDGAALPKLGNFYMRRWFRTLPLYYLILSIYIVLYSVEGTVWSNIYHLGSFPWTHFVFWQGVGRFKQADLGFFSVSWSLAVEEWFYVLFPALIILFRNTAAGIFRTPAPQRVLAVLLAVFLPAVLFGRFLVARGGNFDPDVAKDTFLRLDSIGIGVFFAYLVVFKKRLFSIFAGVPVFVLALCVLAALALLYAYESAAAAGIAGQGGPAVSFVRVLTFDIHSWSASMAVKTLMPDLVSFCCGIVVCFFYNAQLPAHRFFAHTSAQAYSLYLIHVPVYQFFCSFIGQGTSLPTIALMTCCIVVTVAALSYLFHKFYEKPIMDMRDKEYFPFSHLSVKPV